MSSDFTYVRTDGRGRRHTRKRESRHFFIRLLFFQKKKRSWKYSVYNIILIHVSMLTTFLSVFKRCLDMYVEETIDKSFEESPQQQRQQQSSVQKITLADGTTVWHDEDVQSDW